MITDKVMRLAPVIPVLVLEHEMDWPALARIFVSAGLPVLEVIWQMGLLHCREGRVVLRAAAGRHARNSVRRRFDRRQRRRPHRRRATLTLEARKPLQPSTAS